MKLCPNPDCLSSRQRRAFYDDDTICPRCGEVLVTAAGVDPAPAAAYGAAAPGPARTAAISSEMALVGAIGTMLLAFLLIALMVGLNVIHRHAALGQPAVPPAGQGGDVLSVPSPVPGPAGTATVHALATLAAQPTPLGGYTAPTLPPGFTTQALPTLPPGLGGGGAASPAGTGNAGNSGATATPGGGAGTNSGAGGTNSGGGGSPTNPGGSNPAGVPGGLQAANPGNNANSVSAGLCRRIDAGQLCETVTGYSPRDTFYLAVQANFSPTTARKIRVRLYGPPNGTAPLLTQDQTNIPGQTGRFWVGFAFSQTQPWAPGRYQADIFVNDDTTRTTSIAWDVQ